jgi:hypothetical protein
MISARLIQMIEEHSDQITAQVVRQIRQDPRMIHMARLPETELRDQCQEILKKLGHWLAVSKEAEIAAHYEELGRLRMQEDIPLHEVVRSHQVLKARMLDYIRDQGLGQTTIELYAEEELEHQIGHFFDLAVYHAVRGFETATRHVARAAV